MEVDSEDEDLNLDRSSGPPPGNYLSFSLLIFLIIRSLLLDITFVQNRNIFSKNYKKSSEHQVRI
jgi:hypothetical protein